MKSTAFETPANALLYCQTDRVPRCAVALLCLLGITLHSGVRAQEPAAITNLGYWEASGAAFTERYLVHHVDESTVGQDLNGDSDVFDLVTQVIHLDTGESTNLGFFADESSITGKWLLLSVEEYLDQDRNGDGDTADRVLHVHNLETRSTTNLQVAVNNVSMREGAVEGAVFVGTSLVFPVWERAQGQDLNSDGDREDYVLHTHDLDSGQTTNLTRQVGVVGDAQGLAGWGLKSSKDWLTFFVDERDQHTDLNGDGDSKDAPVAFVYDAATGETRNLRLVTNGQSVFHGDWLELPLVEEASQNEDLNRDGDLDDRVVHVHDLATGETTNLGAHSVFGAGSARPAENWLVYAVFESFLDEDLNGDGDREDQVVHVRDFATGETTNLRLVYQPYLDGMHRTTVWASRERVLALSVEEFAQGEDLNGDGDVGDRVLHILDLVTGRLTNVGVAGSGGVGPLDRVSGYLPSENCLSFRASESQEGRDLNGDGDTLDEVVFLHEVRTGETSSLGLAGYASRLVADRWVVIMALEEDQGEDFNLDGDEEDAVRYLYDSITRRALSLRTAPYQDVLVAQDSIAFHVVEASFGDDLNGDGDVEDVVGRIDRLSTGETTILGAGSFYTNGGRPQQIPSGEWLFFSASESSQGRDLNNDGDTDDQVPVVYRVSTGETVSVGIAWEPGSCRPVVGSPHSPLFRLGGDWLVFGVPEEAEGRDLNADGDRNDSALHAHHLVSGNTFNLGLASCQGGALREDWLVVRGDGDPQEEWGEWGYFLVDLGAVSALPSFLRGDCNDDGNFDISDAVSTLGSLFLGQGEPSCDDACDSNDDGNVDISDAVATLGVLFLGQGPVPLPGPETCGFDATVDSLACEIASECP